MAIENKLLGMAVTNDDTSDENRQLKERVKDLEPIVAKLVQQIGCTPAIEGQITSALGLGPLASEMRLTQIKFALDSAPRLIIQPAAAKDFVDALPFGSNQEKLDLVTKLGVLSMTLMTVTSMFRMLEPILVEGAERLNDLLG